MDSWFRLRATPLDLSGPRPSICYWPRKIAEKWPSKMAGFWRLRVGWLSCWKRRSLEAPAALEARSVQGDHRHAFGRVFGAECRAAIRGSPGGGLSRRIRAGEALCTRGPAATAGRVARSSSSSSSNRRYGQRLDRADLEQGLRGMGTGSSATRSWPPPCWTGCSTGATSSTSGVTATGNRLNSRESRSPHSHPITAFPEP